MAKDKMHDEDSELYRLYTGRVLRDTGTPRRPKPRTVEEWR